jgi:hypothetical protein
MSRLNPAAKVVERLGGVRATARIVECTPGAVSRWMMTREKRGTEGRIPQKHWHKILVHSAGKRLGVKLSDLAGL